MDCLRLLTNLWYSADRMPTVDETAILSESQRLLFTQVDPENSDHVGLLHTLWNSLIAADPHLRNLQQAGDIKFALSSPLWKAAGFQQPSVVSDIRGGGLLSIIFLTYLCDHYPDEFAALSATHRKLRAADVAHGFPVSTTAINVARVAAVACGLSGPGGVRCDVAAVKRSHHGWTAASLTALCEVFCAAFLALDATFRDPPPGTPHPPAAVAGFGAAMGRTETALARALRVATGPAGLRAELGLPLLVAA